MSSENARRTENAWKERAAESSAHQAAAAGMGPPPGLGGPGPSRPSRGAPVYVTGASDTFVEQFARTWRAPGAGTGEEGRPGGALDPVIQDQRAITELSRQMMQDLDVTANMVLNHQASAARAMVSLAQDMRTIRQEERDHMQGILDMLSVHSDQQLKIAQAIQAAHSGTGAGPGGPLPGGTTSGSPMPRGGGPRRRTRPPGATPPPAGGGGGTPPGSGGGGGGGNPPAFVPTPLPRPHPTTYRGMRRQFFNAVNNRYGIPAANAAQAAPTGAQSLISNIAGPMASMGMRAIPVLGAGIAVVNGVVDGMEWLTEQRKANAQYQQIYGGDNFGLTDTIQGLFGGDVNTGSGQRAAGFGFRMSQLFSHGGLTGDDADKLFQGVSALGYNNAERDKQLRFGTTMYKQQGMSVDDSMRLIDISARYANQSLAGVADGLTQVSKAAQQTGQSAKTLRDTFTNYYGAALAGGAGASAGTIAQAMTLSTAGMSRQLAGANMTPMLSNPMYLQQIATGAGMTSGQLQSQMAQGNFMAFAGSAQKILDQRMLGVMDPSVRKQFTQLVNEYGGNEVVAEGPGAISGIATELMGNKGWNVYAARSALQSIGVDTSAMNDQQVAEFFVAQMTSGGMGAQAKKKQEENKPKDIRGQIEERGVPDFWFETKQPGMVFSKSANEYIEREKKTGKSDPAMEAAIKTFGTNNDQKVEVQTKQGTRIVTLSEAIRDYGDQISTGTAIVAEGEHKGKKLSEVTGVTTTGVVPGKNGVPNTAKENAKSGQTKEEYEKDRPFLDKIKDMAGEGPGGVVRIEPSPELARLLHFTATGNVNVDNSAAQGVPPAVNGPTK